MNCSACEGDRRRAGVAFAGAGARRRSGYSGSSGGKPFPGGAAVPPVPLRGGSLPLRCGLCEKGAIKYLGTNTFTGRQRLVASSWSGRRSVALPLPSTCLPRKRNQPGSKKRVSYESCFATQDLGRTISCHLFLPRSWGRQCWGWERGAGGCRLTSPSCSSMALLLRLGCSLLALSTCLLPRVRADCGRDCAACAYRLGPRASIHPLVSGSGAGEAARPLQSRGDP